MTALLCGLGVLVLITISPYIICLFGAVHGYRGCVIALLVIVAVSLCGLVYTNRHFRSDSADANTEYAQTEEISEKDIIITAYQLKKEGLSEEQIVRLLASIYNISEEEAAEYVK